MTIVILPACGVHMPGSKILLRGDTVMYACWCQISSHFWQIPIHVWCMQWNLQLVQLLQPECTLLVKSVTVSESCHLQTLDYFLQYHIIGLQILVLVLWTLKLQNARAELYSWWCSCWQNFHTVVFFFNSWLVSRGLPIGVKPQNDISKTGVDRSFRSLVFN